MHISIFNIMEKEHSLSPKPIILHKIMVVVSHKNLNPMILMSFQFKWANEYLPIG